MSTTRIHHHIAAPRHRVYAALLDANAVATWMVPPDMRSEVHNFEPHEGGGVRISLDEKVVQCVEFETDDPAMQGTMTIAYTLSDAADGGTDLLAVHDHLPPGISAADNELGWRLSLDQLAALVEVRSRD